MQLKKILSYIHINYVQLFNIVEKYQPTYNPQKYKIFGNNFTKRETEDRVKFIEKYIPWTKVKSLLDIGSLFGYFVFRLSENRNIIAHGADISFEYIAYSRAIANLNEIDKTSFMTMELNSKSAKMLPKYNLILFLNVFHHIVHFQGFESADKIMRSLVSSCDYFIFETGTYTEKNQYWTKDLLFMGSNTNKWIETYLGELGLRIISVKKFSNHLNNVKRSVYVCQKII
jgi:hypothetical protein